MEKHPCPPNSGCPRSNGCARLFDNGGRLDVLVTTNGGAPILLKNNAGQTNSWVGLRLSGTKSNRDGIGAKITWSAGGVKKTRLKTSGGGYLSSHDQREILGLGQTNSLDWIEVEWPAPSTQKDRVEKPPLGRYLRIVEGQGLAP